MRAAGVHVSIACKTAAALRASKLGRAVCTLSQAQARDTCSPTAVLCECRYALCHVVRAYSAAEWRGT